MKLVGNFTKRDGTRTNVYYTTVRLWPAVFLKHDPMLKRLIHVSPWRDRIFGHRNDSIVIYWRWPWDQIGHR